MIIFLNKLWKYIIITLNSKYRWLLILFVLWLYRVEFMPDTGAGIGKAIQVGALTLLSFLLVKERSTIVKDVFSKTNWSVGSILLLYVYAMISTFWAFIPQFAFFLSFQNVVMILLIVYVFSLCNSFKSLEKTFIYSVLSIGLFEAICVRIINPSIFCHFLAGGSSAALLLTYSVGEFLNLKNNDKERKSLLKNAIVISAILLIINTSGGANASALFGVGVAMFFSGKKLYSIVLVFTGFYLLANQDLVDDILLVIMPGKTMEVIEVGNGRDFIWERILGYAAIKPWFGWGFACVERIDQEIFGGQSLSDAHNNYIGFYGSLGIVGCILYGIHLIQVFLATFPNLRYMGFLGLFCAFCCSCMNGYTYGFLSGKACSITIVYFMVIVLTFYYKKVNSYDGQDAK